MGRSGKLRVPQTLTFCGTAVYRIRIPKTNWGRVWRTLVAAGPLTCVKDESLNELVYFITDRQLKLLRRKKLSFDLLGVINGSYAEKNDG